MDYLLFMKASLVGLSIAAPVGPIGLLCMQRTLSSGVKVGFASGLGAATADALYGAAGAFGLTAFIQVFTAVATPLAVMGGVFLIWMGTQFLRTAQGKATAETGGLVGRHVIKAFASTLALTITNPMTILSFMAVFAALSGTAVIDPNSAATMVAGVFIGSTVWWLLLVAVVSLVRHKLEGVVMQRIGQVAGIALISFGAWQLYSVLL